MIETLGMIIFTYYLIEIVQQIYQSLQPIPDIQKKYGKNCWAVVTGSTDGIGKAYCQLLAKQNVNVCLIARNEQKVKQVIEELKVNSKSQFKYVIADFQKCAKDSQFFDKIYNELKDLDIGLLINNVGLLFKTSLIKQQDQTLKDIIDVNCFPIVLLTKKLLPQLKNRKKSAILNMSSINGILTCPLHQIYVATKAFDDFFSRSISSEFDNIDVLALRPFLVTTTMTKQTKENGAISSIACAQGGLQRLGFTTASHGHWYHRLQGLIFSRLLPEKVSYFIMKQLIKEDKV